MRIPHLQAATEIRINGVAPVLRELQRRALLLEKTPRVAEVGYETRYAIYVHEDLTANHPHGQAKFLEYPARVMVRALTETVAEGVERGLGFSVAMFKAAVRLLDASRPLVPVDTGMLKDSGFALVTGTNLKVQGIYW